MRDIRLGMISACSLKKLSMRQRRIRADKDRKAPEGNQSSAARALSKKPQSGIPSARFASDKECTAEKMGPVFLLVAY